MWNSVSCTGHLTFIYFVYGLGRHVVRMGETRNAYRFGGGWKMTTWKTMKEMGR
jgi:hypothetical protein